MAKKKKNQQNVDGNTFNQDFQNIKSIQEYVAWKDNAQKISGTSIGVANIETLWDFLVNHVTKDVIRQDSINAGRDKDGTYPSIDFMEQVLERGVLTKADVIQIKLLAKDLEALKDGTLDPRLIVFTEIDYDEDSGEEVGRNKLQGHYRTDKYVKRRKKAGKDDGIPAVPTGWYSGSGNPPSFALFGGNETYAKPRALYEILRDISADIGKAGEKVFIDELEVLNLRGRNQVETLAGLSGVEKYFDDAINNAAFWNEGGKLLVNKLQKDFATKDFKITPREQTLIRRISGIGNDKESTAGTIREAKFTSTSTPLIDLINAALIRADKKTAPSEFRAWQNARRGGFDYRRTRREKFGEDAQGNPDAKVISKRWQEYLWRQ